MSLNDWLGGDTHHAFALIGGDWEPLRGVQATKVIDPSTLECVATVQESNEADVDRAVAAAKGALPVVAALSQGEREVLLRRFADELERRAELLTQVVSAEMGMPLKYCGDYQVLSSVGVVRATADTLADLSFIDRIKHSIIRHEPVGVVGAIVPWNYPILQTVSKIAPSFAAGCTIVLKPSEVTPVDALILAEAWVAAGMPPGSLNLVLGTGQQAGEALVRHPDVAMISLTGSTRAGRRVAQIASGSIKRVALELGGKSPAVVLPDADLAAAVANTVETVAVNTGQTCTALTRLVVPADRLDEAEQLVAQAMAGYRIGVASDPESDLGPVANANQHHQVTSHVERALLEGVRHVYESPAEALPGRGLFVPLHAFTVTDPKSALAQEEVFGPVLAIQPYFDESEAIEIANATDYGLAATVWSNDAEHALAIAARIESGTVNVNDAVFNGDAPFGGFKQSGIGRELGAHGIFEFTETKSVQTNGAIA